MAAELSGLRNMRQVTEMTGMSRSGVYVAMKEDGFPRPIRYRGRSLWVALEVSQWCDERVKQCPRVGSSMGKAA